MKKQPIRLHKIFTLLGIVYFFFLTGIYLLQEKIIFMPTSEIYLEIDTEKIGAEEFNLEIDKSTNINGYFVKTENATKTIIFSHGNGGNITNNFSRIALAKKMGLNLAIFDYRGYGKSTGKIASEEDIYQDAEAVYEYVTDEMEIPRDSIVFWGQSLGGAVATEMNLRHPADKLILESTFTSMNDLSPAVFKYGVPRFLKKYKFNNLEKLAKFSTPIMIIHSPEDEMINYSNAEKLFENSGENKELIITDGTHNDGLLEKFADYEERIKQFIES